MVTASSLLQIWSFRLRMDDERKKWSPSIRASIECLVERLQTLPPSKEISIDADENRSPIAKFILVETGEVLGEIDKHAEPFSGTP